jgi:phage terminase large subunit-like protein
LFSKHYIPEDRTIGEDLSHYAGWARDGYLTVTPGSRIDIDYIQEDIEELAKNHDMAGEENGGGEVCFDQYNTAQLIPKLENKNIACVDIPQNVRHLSEPMKEIEAAVKDGKFHHDGNPVTIWAFGNVTCFEDRNGNVFPRKEGKENKIDPAVASITAMNRAMVNKIDKKSVYEGRGVVLL